MEGEKRRKSENKIVKRRIGKKGKIGDRRSEGRCGKDGVRKRYRRNWRILRKDKKGMEKENEKKLREI